MSRVIDFKTQELKEISFSSVLSHLGAEIEEKGRRVVTKCLWHDDRNPSLYINEDKHYCHCFVCGKSWSNIDYVMQYRGVGFREACEWMREEFRISGTLDLRNSGMRDLGNEGGRKTKTKKKCEEIQQDYWSCFNPEYVEQHVSMENCFSRCLLHYFSREVVEAVTHNYCLGCYHFRNEYVDYPDDVMFPSIDKDLVVHNIKLQHYETNPESEQFFHCNRKHILWMGKMLQDSGDFPADAKFDNSTLFGEHLIPLQPDKIVALVESPKNALIGACAMPDFVWVATGNKTNISRRNMEVLRERKVLVLPDVDAVDDWKRELGKMGAIGTFVFSSLTMKYEKESPGLISFRKVTPIVGRNSE